MEKYVALLPAFSPFFTMFSESVLTAFCTELLSGKGLTECPTCATWQISYVYVITRVCTMIGLSLEFALNLEESRHTVSK